MRCRSADRDQEIVVRLAVEDTGVVERADEHHSEGEADAADIFAEEDGGGFNTDFHVIATVLAGVDGVYSSQGRRKVRERANVHRRAVVMR